MDRWGPLRAPAGSMAAAGDSGPGAAGQDKENICEWSTLLSVTVALDRQLVSCLVGAPLSAAAIVRSSFNLISSLSPPAPAADISRRVTQRPIGGPLWPPGASRLLGHLFESPAPVDLGRRREPNGRPPARSPIKPAAHYVPGGGGGQASRKRPEGPRRTRATLPMQSGRLATGGAR